MDRCKNYCGIACVTGEPCNSDCDNCFFYNGCDDCYFVDTDYCDCYLRDNDKFGTK